MRKRADLADDVVPTGVPARAAVAKRTGQILDRMGAFLALFVCAALTLAVYGPALRFAFTFDDPLDLPRAEGRSAWSMFRTSAGYAYYRPIPFVLWKGLRALQGCYSEFSLHGLTLAAHILAAWFLYLLLRRLVGGHWGILPAILFITYPFSYQAAFGAHTLFHPLMTAAILLSLMLYYDGRIRTADCGVRHGNGSEAGAAPPAPPASRLLRLAVSVLAAVIALWTHESGVVILPLVVGLEALILARTRSWRPSWWPALHGIATAIFLLVWKTVPRDARPDQWSPDSLLPNARYFLQGVIWPVAAELQPRGARFGFDAVRALWPAIGGTLLALVVIYALGRRPWVPLVALGAAAVVLVPAWAVLTWAYVEDAPRLLYPAAPAIAALWGLLPALRFRSRALTWGWRMVTLVALIAVTIQSMAFIGVRRDMWAEGTTLINGVADTAAAHGDRPLLFLNVPAWFAPKRPEYPVGHVGLTALPGYVGLGRSVYIHRGVQPPLESRGYYPDVNGWKYDFNTHGSPASLDDFAALVRRVDMVYRVELLPTGGRVREVGSVRPGAAARGAAGPRFGPGAVLSAASFELRGDELLIDMTWEVAVPPPGDFAPVLRVRDGAGRIVVEGRAYPLADIAAPRLWKAGDQVRDLPALRLPANLPPGAYTVWLSWEEHSTRAPLAAVGVDGAPLPTEGLSLGSFTAP